MFSFLKKKFKNLKTENSTPCENFQNISFYFIKIFSVMFLNIRTYYIYIRFIAFKLKIITQCNIYSNTNEMK